MALYEIKHRYNGQVLFSLDCRSLKLCVEAAIYSRADLSGADLSGANLYGANLSRANLYGTSLSGASLVDGGQDKRGYRFYACKENSVIIYRAGCREWRTYEEAITHYDESYSNSGDRLECLARINLMHEIAVARWAIETTEVS